MGTFSCRPAGVAVRRFGPAIAFAILNLFAHSLRAQSCAPAPAGLVGLWRGENSAGDLVTGSEGRLVNNVGFAAGFVGQAFKVDGYRSGIVLNDREAFHLQDFTIEAWIRRENASAASVGPHGGEIFSYGYEGYGFGIEDDGTLFLTKVGINHVALLKAVTDTLFHHVAVTKTGSKVVFYVDGRAYPMPPYHTRFEFSTPPAIGTRGDYLLNSFMGMIDEVALYNRPLKALEVKAIYDAGSAGKCAQVTDKEPLSRSTVPSLAITIVGGNIVLSWPAAFSTFQLESSSNLAGSDWFVEPSLIVQSGARVTITLPIASASRFYRLKSQ
jgi:hypothetical protein